MVKLLVTTLFENLPPVEHQHGSRQSRATITDLQHQVASLNDRHYDFGYVTRLFFHHHLMELPSFYMSIGVNITLTCQEIKQYLSTLNKIKITIYLELSPGKSSATLFTLWTKEVNTTLDIVKMIRCHA